MRAFKLLITTILFSLLMLFSCTSDIIDPVLENEEFENFEKISGAYELGSGTIFWSPNEGQINSCEFPAVFEIPFKGYEVLDGSIPFFSIGFGKDGRYTLEYELNIPSEVVLCHSDLVAMQIFPPVEHLKSIERGIYSIDYQNNDDLENIDTDTPIESITLNSYAPGKTVLEFVNDVDENEITGSSIEVNINFSYEIKVNLILKQIYL